MMQLTLKAMMMRLGFIQYMSDDIFNEQVIDYIDDQLNIDDYNVKTLLQNVQKTGVGGQGDIISFKA